MVPTIDDVYRKFGETSEAAQLLETELGTLLLAHNCVDAGLFEADDPETGREIYRRIDSQTLGQLIRNLGAAGNSIEGLEEQLAEALSVRNRLAHAFYRQHNLRRNSDDGCQLMLTDLENMHSKLLDAYKAVMLLSGVDLDKLVADGRSPVIGGHLPIP